MPLYGSLKKYIDRFNAEITAGIMLIFLLVQRFIISFEYYPSSDDWFLYYGRSVAPESEQFLDLVTRPLAGLADRFLLTPLADNMVIAEIILVIMLCAAGYFFCKAFRASGIACGTVFFISLIMAPVGFEGFYWLSASTRIIPSLFFIGASALSLSLFLDTRGKPYLILYILTGMGAVGFYEIFLPVYFLVSVFIVISRRKSWWLIIIPAALSCLIMAYYLVNGSNPEISDRASMIAPNNIIGHTIYALGEYETMLAHANAALTRDSFGDGIRVLLQNPFSAVIVLLIPAALAFMSDNSRKFKGRVNFYAGLLLAVAGMLLNMLIDYVRVPFRLSAPMLLGFAVLAELAAGRLFNKYVYKAFVFLMAFAFAACNIGELSLYHYNAVCDNEFADRVAALPEASNPQKITLICNTQRYWYNDRIQYYEYVKAATESYAPITGMVEYKTGAYDINNIMPLCPDAPMGIQNYDDDYVNFIYFDENNAAVHCSAQKVGDDYAITDENGNAIGSLTLQNDAYYYTNAE